MKKTYIFEAIIIILLISLLALSSIFNKNKLKLYSQDMYYMDTLINIKLYAKSDNDANIHFKEIDNVFSSYHKLTDPYNKYENINNVYYINNNKDNIKDIQIDNKLYNLISDSLNIRAKTDYLFNINLGCQIEIWKTYRDSGEGIPSISELNNCKSNEIVLLPDNKILNNHPNINLGGVAKGYATKEASLYLKNNNVKYFLINAGGNVEVGDNYLKPYYKIGIENSLDKSNLKVLKVNNIAVITSGSSERFYTYNGIKYGHIIDPRTSWPNNNYNSVSVITSDGMLGDILSTTLFLTDIETGKKIINRFDTKIEVIWHTLNNEIITTEGISEYE